MTKNNTEAPQSHPHRRKWAPYILLFPTLVYLVLFFAYPMARALSLALYKEESVLRLRETPAADSPVQGRLDQATQIIVLEAQGNPVESVLVAGIDSAAIEAWYRISGPDENGNAVEGWIYGPRLRILDTDEQGGATRGRVRLVRRSGVDPGHMFLPNPACARKLSPGWSPRPK
jgi:multiple sugar transport system permease protein